AIRERGPNWQTQNSSALSASATSSCFTSSLGSAFAGLLQPLRPGPRLSLSGSLPCADFFCLWQPECSISRRAIRRRGAFGPFPAFMAAWTYWISNLPYFPAILFFAASSLLYLGGPMKRLADSPLYFVAFTVVMLALITLMNVVGLNTGKWLNNLGAIGTLIPALILVALGIISFLRFGSATYFTVGAMVPRARMKNFIFLSTIFFAFGGC